MNSEIQRPILPPFRSAAAALLFCIAFGPVGLLYASLTGGIILMGAGLFLLRAHLFVLFGVVWLIACVWGVAATQWHNRRIFRRQFV